jgi:hypothetical protein
VLSLCIALETMLTDKHDYSKGALLACRMSLLHSFLSQGNIDPVIILWLYRTRSAIVHGERAFLASDRDYSRLLWAARSTLFNFVEIVYKKNICEQREFFAILVEDKYVDLLIQWFYDRGEELKKDTIKALKNSRKGLQDK